MRTSTRQPSPPKPPRDDSPPGPGPKGGGPQPGTIFHTHEQKPIRVLVNLALVVQQGERMKNARKISLGMTELEYQLVSSLAKAARLNLTNYLRQCVGLRLRNYVRHEVLASIRAFEAEARRVRHARYADRGPMAPATPETGGRRRLATAEELLESDTALDVP